MYGAIHICKFCLSVTLIVAIATLLSRSACRFSEAKLQEMVNIGLTLASSVKYHFGFRTSTQKFSLEPNFSQIRPEIKNPEISKDTIARDKR